MNETQIEYEILESWYPKDLGTGITTYLNEKIPDIKDEFGNTYSVKWKLHGGLNITQSAEYKAKLIYSQVMVKVMELK